MNNQLTYTDMTTSTTFRHTLAMIALMGALGLAVATCAGGTEGAADASGGVTESPPAQDVPITAEGLHGYWLNTGGASSLFVDFRKDGTFTIGNEGRLGDASYTHGIFEAIDETTIEFSTADDATDCPGVTMTWTGVANDHGVMAVDALAPDCEVPSGTQWEWTRVSPASTASLMMQAGDLETDPAAATEISEIEGLWLRPGTSDVLAIDQAGTYLLTADGNSLEPLDAGTYDIDAPGVLTFTSDGSGRCDTGDGWTWRGVTTAKDLLRENEARGFSLRADSSELCGSTGGSDSWRLLAPEKI